MDEQEIIDAAAKRFAEDCEARGAIYSQPCSASTYVEGDVVTLANVNGTLARYRFEDDGDEVNIVEELDVGDEAD